MARSKKSKGSSITRWVIKVLLFMFVSSFCYVLLCKWVMPPITVTQVSNYISGYGMERDYVSWTDISPNVVLAAIASEDQLYLEHGGFDWKAIERSFEQSQQKKKRRRPAGAAASTISQQTAKNVFLWQGGGITKYVRKVPEFYFTKLIELTWGKKRIMEVYLNTIEMGPGIFGIEAASRAYFKKPAKQLTRMEAATIIAALPNPKRYTVVPMSKWVKWKRQLILKQMANIEGSRRVKELIR